jgi:heme exporter protein B
MSAPGLFALARAQWRRDLALVWRHRGESLQPAFFAALLVALFPLGLGAEPNLLGRIAPAVIWAAVLVSSVLGLESLYRSDVEDGSLEQQRLSGAPLAWLVAVRVALHWAVTALPLLLLAPLLAQWLFLPSRQLGVLMLGLALGTPLLSLIGAVLAALTAGIRRSGILLPLLALPLFLPVLVFGAGAVVAAAQGQDWVGAILLLAAGLVAAAVAAPLAAAAALRISLS